MAEIKPTIQYVPDLAKSAIILALTPKLRGKSQKERDGLVRMNQVLSTSYKMHWQLPQNVKPWSYPCGKHGQSLRILLFELTQDLLDHLPVFQRDGQKDGFH
jgi:hypothetical protein